MLTSSFPGITVTLQCTVLRVLEESSMLDARGSKTNSHIPNQSGQTNLHPGAAASLAAIPEARDVKLTEASNNATQHDVLISKAPRGSGYLPGHTA